jgi:hypothetical protein
MLDAIQTFLRGFSLSLTARQPPNQLLDSENRTKIALPEVNVAGLAKDPNSPF